MESSPAKMTENEEFEFRLRLESESKAAPSVAPTEFSVPARPKTFNADETQAARMTNAATGTRQVPVDSPMQRFLYEAGGRVTDRLANAGASPEVAAGGGYLTNLAGQIGTTFLGGNLGAKAEPAMQALGTRFMQSALKPDRAAIDSGRAEKAIQTLLDEGINATKGGASILRDKVNILQDEVKDILAMHPNAAVDKQHVYDALASSIDKAMKQGTPQSDLVILRKAVMNFAQHPLLQASADVPVQLAQELKQGVWRKLSEKSFGKGLVPDASRDAQKAIGSGLKTGIEEVVPEVGPVNAKTQEFLNTLKLVEKRTGIEGNKNIIGLGALSPSMESFLAWMIDRYPAGKSMLARYFYSHADPAMAGAAVGAVTGAQSGKAPNK